MFLFPTLIGSGVHPASDSVVTWTLSLGVKHPGCEASLSPPSTVKVQNVELYLHSPTCLHGVVLNHIRNNITFYI
jgi:hypothetical protein